MNFGGQRTSQMIAALVLQFSTLHFCSLEKEKKKEKKIGKTAPVGRLATAGPQCTGF
jgi:hypothetical protein